MKKFDESLYVVEMYQDDYYPNFLVNKVKTALMKVVDFLETEDHNMKKIQNRFDIAMKETNNLIDEFDENGSEIETFARESIGQTVTGIIKHLQLDLDCETAMQERDW
ncbi:MAG: hypothetical protein GX312_03680 [Candidatus Phytoplasma sp.]|nr:hypothetical protein [Phytoplasma sp.]